MNFLCENNLPKDLKSKRSVATWQPSHDPLFSYIFNKLNWSMRGSSFKQIIRKYRKLHITVCFVRLSQIRLQQLFTGKSQLFWSLTLPAVVVLYFTASEKDNLRTESYSYKEQILSQCTGKQNYVLVLKNEKNSDYYYLSNRKMILSKLAGLLFPRKFNKRTTVCSLWCVKTAIWFFHWRQR